jgi:hypothetical protein
MMRAGLPPAELAIDAQSGMVIRARDDDDDDD